ncbi:MAG: hypothetical protein MI892_21805, partial [Desulfobacterales bacterium]|nr:hypothetical protein [Desulfobacterales bacterium]
MKTRSRKLWNLIVELTFALVLTVGISGPALSDEDIAPGPAGSAVPVAQSLSFTGAATQQIPIVVPPGRKGIGPKLSLTYNSYQKNGWIGVGWSLEMGAIQRATRRGVDYDAFDFVASVNGSTSELVPRSEWGAHMYGAKIEGAFSRYENPDPETSGWVVTTKDGTRYFYGTSADSRQYELLDTDPTDTSRTFKWCLDRVEDPNGNFMTVSYTKDQGEIYLSRIDYTGNSETGMGTVHAVTFHLESRNDAPTRYTSKFPVS